MAVEIQFEPGVPFQRVATQLSGLTYLLDLSWNSRAEAWYMSIYTDDDEPVRLGMRVALGAMLGVASANENFPPGFFYAFDNSQQDLEASFNDIGTRVSVVYREFSEL